MRSFLFLVFAALAAFGQDRVVTVYVSTDFEHAEPILKEFEKATGIKVEAVSDTEDNKTVGLVNRLIAEAGATRADVFWNNETAQAIRLAKKGLLAPYVSPNAAGIPAGFKEPSGLWTGFGARGRVLVVNTQAAEPKSAPTRVADLADPRWKGTCVMSKPLFGTTLTHAAVLASTGGRESMLKWFTSVLENGTRFEKGNAPAMKEVSDGGRPFGLTDTDDAHAARLDGKPIVVIYPDQGKDDPRGAAHSQHRDAHEGRAASRGSEGVHRLRVASPKRRKPSRRSVPRRFPCTRECRSLRT
jgi:iron(III) transport system substrate-binding protein